MTEIPAETPGFIVVEGPIGAGKPRLVNRLSEAYSRFFYFYDQAPVLSMNAGDINPVEHDADCQPLMQEICRPQQGKRYINPLPLAINSGTIGTTHRVVPKEDR